MHTMRAGRSFKLSGNGRRTRAGIKRQHKKCAPVVETKRHAISLDSEAKGGRWPVVFLVPHQMSISKRGGNVFLRVTNVGGDDKVDTEE